MAGRIPDMMLVNNNTIPEESLRRYRRKEHKVAVIADSLIAPAYGTVQLLRADLWAKTREGYIIHDPEKLAMALSSVLI